MEYKQKVDIAVALLLLLISGIVLIIPLFNMTNLNLVMNIIFASYSIINIIQFLLTKKSKDFEGMHTSLASLVALGESIVLDLNSNYKFLALTLMTWITLMSLIKLKKTDYYHDRNDRMWKIRSLTLILFILTGLLTCINLAYEDSVRIIIIGYFFFIHAILELIDPILKTLIKHG